MLDLSVIILTKDEKLHIARWSMPESGKSKRRATTTPKKYGNGYHLKECVNGISF